MPGKSSERSLADHLSTAWNSHLARITVHPTMPHSHNSISIERRNSSRRADSPARTPDARHASPHLNTKTSYFRELTPTTTSHLLRRMRTHLPPQQVLRYDHRIRAGVSAGGAHTIAWCAGAAPAHYRSARIHRELKSGANVRPIARNTSRRRPLGQLMLAAIRYRPEGAPRRSIVAAPRDPAERGGFHTARAWACELG